MAIRIGNDGAIRLVSEATYGTDPGVGYVFQHARAASLTYNKALLPNPRLTSANPDTRAYGTAYGEGEIEIAWDDSRAVVGDLLANAGALATSTYTIDGTTPDDNSLTIHVDYGGYAWAFTGCKMQSIRWEFTPEQPVVCKAAFVAQGVATESAFANPASLPTVAGVVWASEITSLQVDSTNVCFISGAIQVDFPLIGGIDRQCLAGGVKEPVWAGQTVVSAELTGELGNDTGANTEAILADWLAGTTVGSVAIATASTSWTVGNCYVMGDAPTLGDGITQFNLKVEGNTLDILTTA